MKNSILFTLTFFFCFTVSAQKLIIKGRITDAQSKEGLPSANVFINNTTLGQSSNLDGFYQFSNINLKEFDLVFRYVGYETTTRKIVSKDEETITIDIELKPLQNALSEVEIKSKRDKKWEKQLKTFKNVFLGYSDFAKKCEIENPWILDFEERGDVFEVKTDQTLKVSNQALGYIMYFDFKKFEVEKDAYKIATNVSFIEMAPPSKQKMEEWLRNRKESYKKSVNYFAKTAAYDELKSKGFMLFAEKPGSNDIRTDNFIAELDKSIMAYPTKDMVGPGKMPGAKKVYIRKNLEVHNQNSKSELKTYRDVDYGVSWLNVNGNYIYVDPIGTIQNSQDIIVSGDMDYYKTSGLLPLNYDANVEVTDAYFLNLEKPSFGETVHLHTDRNVFWPEEKIWFKAYLNYSSFAATDTSSKVLYIQLSDANQKILIKQKLEIEAGYAYGQVSLPTGLASGTYTLSAFTSYSLNFKKNMFNQPIHILSLSEKPALLSLEDDEVIDALNISLTEIEGGLNMEIKNKAGKAVESNFSVSVTNPNLVPASPNTLLKDLSLPKEKLVFPLKFPMEKGLLIDGVLFDKKKNPLKTDFVLWANSLENVVDGNANASGAFSVSNLSFFDDADLYLKVKSKKYTENIVIVNQKSLEAQSKIFEENIKTDKIAIPMIFEKEKELEKQETAKETQVTEDNEPKMIYGRPDYKILEKDIIKTNGTQGIVNSITSRVPSVRYTPGGFLIRGGATTVGGNKIALMLIDGVPNNNFGALDPNNIKKIEIVSRIVNMYGDQGANGLISIFLKTGKSDEVVTVDKNTVKFGLKGYTSPQFFDYASSLKFKELGSPTYYWNSELQTDKTGNVKIEIEKLIRPCRVSIEGVTQNNIPFRRDFILKEKI